VQYEINAVGRRLQEQNYSMGTYIIRDAMSSVDVGQIDNGVMSEVVWSGSKPEFANPPAMPPDLLSWYTLIRTQLPSEITGFSQSAVRGEREPGVESGRGQRIVREQATEGLEPFMRRYDADMMCVTRQILHLFEEIADEGKEPIVVSGAKVPVESELSFGEFRESTERLNVVVYPVGFMTGSPEDKFERIVELAQYQVAGPEDIARLLSSPDMLGKYNQGRFASENVVEFIVDKILTSDKPYEVVEKYTPISQMNLKLCVKRGTEALLQSYIDDVELQNREALVVWIEKARTVDQMGAPPAPPAPPPGDPGMPPQEGIPMPGEASPLADIAVPDQSGMPMLPQ
jgi:hypothetical protein